MEKKKVEGEGVVKGWGKINGSKVYVLRKELKVMGGQIQEKNEKKI